MDKRAIRIEINNLLDRECNRCPYGAIKAQTGNTTSKFVDECQTCPHYKQIRQLGDQLLKRSEAKMKMTVEEYKNFKSQKMNIEEIAKEKQVSPATVYNWKKAHKDEIKNAGIELKATKNDTKSAENAQKVNDSANKLVANKLSNRVKEQESVIAKLRVSLGERDRQVDALLADKKKLLEEQQSNEGTDETVLRTERYAEKIAELEKDNERLEKEKNDLLNFIQNLKDETANMKKGFDSSNANYREKCKQIADLNAAAEDLENEISQLKDDKNDLEHQLAYTGQERDKYFKLARRYGQQLRALEAYVVTILESAK